MVTETAIEIARTRMKTVEMVGKSPNGLCSPGLEISNPN